MSLVAFNDPNGAPWWRDAVVYQVYVRSFADSDGDGLGDLPGITKRLPYLRDLGVDALWITPFYPSPQHDAGYDVSDYVDVDPRFGSLADADALLKKAHALGLKVIVDLVPNHTSDEHEWFQKALAAEPGSPERERFVFRKGKGRGGKQPPNNWNSVFGGIAWERVEDGPDGSTQWYLHIFDRTQPDLNWRNPEVRSMFEDVLRFWLDRGVDGFRVDVAHGLFKDEKLRDEKTPETGPRQHVSLIEHETKDEPMWDQPEVHEVYRDWHRVLDEYDGDRMAVAEAWAQTPERIAAYVRPDELQQAFNFAWLLAKWDAADMADCIRRTFATLDLVGAHPTWVLSNHDVTRHATRYGGGPVGVARARAATLAMLALPGSSYLYQGEELGLESVDVPEELRQDPAWFRTGVEWRDHCRVPMPWGGTEAPFKFGGRKQPWLPMPAEWAGLTVEAQTGKRGSTLEMYRKALKVRRTFAATAPREVEILDRAKSVLAFRRGPITVVLNCGQSSGRVAQGQGARQQRPTRRRQAAAEHGGLDPLTASGVERPVVAAERRHEPGQVLVGPVAEPLVEPLAAVPGHVVEAGAPVVADRDEHRPAVLRVGDAGEQAEVGQVRDLAADRALVDVELLGDRRGAHRAVVGDVREHQVRRRREVRVDRARPVGNDATDPPHHHADLALEVAEDLGPAGGHRVLTSSSFAVASGASSSARRMVVRSGTSRMNSTQRKAATANGTATRKMWPVASPKACSKITRTGPGSESRSGIEWLSVESLETPIAASPPATFAATWWLSTAPRAETPIEPPMLRKNATTELAAPMSAWAVLFCTARTRFCMVAPRPRPRIAM